MASPYGRNWFIAEDGAKLMIENGWLEQPPQATDRDELAKE